MKWFKLAHHRSADANLVRFYEENVNILTVTDVGLYTSVGRILRAEPVVPSLYLTFRKRKLRSMQCVFCQWLVNRQKAPPL